MSSFSWPQAQTPSLPATRNKWPRSDIISLLALLVSIVVAYKAFTDDPIKQQMEHMPRIHAAVAETYFPDGRHYVLRVWNVGILPAKNIKIALSALPGVGFSKNPKDITLDPFSPAKLAWGDRSVILSLDRTLARDQSITLRLTNLTLENEIAGPCIDARIYNDDQGESVVNSYERFDVVPTSYVSRVQEKPLSDGPVPVPTPRPAIGELPPR